MIFRFTKRTDRGPQLAALAKSAGLETHGLEEHEIFYLSHEALTPQQAQTAADFLSDAGHGVVLQPLDEAQGFPIEIAPLPGVTDRTAEELRAAILRLGLPACDVATARGYAVETATPDALAEEVLSNGVVERYALGLLPPVFGAAATAKAEVEQINLDLSDDALEALSKDRRLALSLAEMQVVRDFARREGRTLSEAELEMVAQTWSEHCYHKTFRATIAMTEVAADGTATSYEVPGLLNHYIRAATEACDKPWLISTFVDNAGIVAFDDEFEVSFKVETHNHPSALEPFGGANTGVGGVIRDVIGVSAKPIALTNVLCFGDREAEDLPKGTLHPTRIESGVVAGIADYGNKMGVPTVNGAVIYDEGYNANPLVYCGCVGLAPQGLHTRAPQVGDRVVSIGGLTGRDGLKGATFSSLDLDADTAEADFASTAVQIGNPIVEKDAMEVVLRARDAKLYTAITDCGAGGLSSAIGEMAEELGAHVELNTVTLKYEGLRPWEIWLSEAQERIVLSVPPANMPALQAICDDFGVQLDDVGVMTGDRQMRVTYNGAPVVDLPMELLHDSHPKMALTAEWKAPAPANLGTPEIDIRAATLAILAHPWVASKEQIVRQYDHEVQGGSVVRPFTGTRNHGPSDAAVFKPQGTKGTKALALSNALNPRFNADPYRMALSAVDEAVRNITASGADPDTISLLDNFCWGNPGLPDRLGALVKAAHGCHDGARLFDAPFISGKDSLNNEYVGADGNRVPIPGTILVSAMAMVPDLTRTCTMDLKTPGNRLYLIGQTLPEYGGAFIQEVAPFGNTTVPTVREDALHYARSLHRLIADGHIAACHDLSEGGLAVALAEMALASDLGATITVDDPATLFSESNTRWVVEVTPENARALERTTLDLLPLGEVTEGPLTFGTTEITLQDIETAWRGHLGGTQ